MSTREGMKITEMLDTNVDGVAGNSQATAEFLTACLGEVSDYAKSLLDEDQLKFFRKIIISYCGTQNIPPTMENFINQIHEKRFSGVYNDLSINYYYGDGLLNGKSLEEIVDMTESIKRVFEGFIDIDIEKSKSRDMLIAITIVFYLPEIKDQRALRIHLDNIRRNKVHIDNANDEIEEAKRKIEQLEAKIEDTESEIKDGINIIPDLLNDLINEDLYLGDFEGFIRGEHFLRLVFEENGVYEAENYYFLCEETGANKDAFDKTLVSLNKLVDIWSDFVELEVTEVTESRVYSEVKGDNLDARVIKLKAKRKEGFYI